MKCIYEGSVKNIWEVDSTTLEFEYTDAFSVFDWGRMPEGLSYKGESLAALGAYFFEKMKDLGMAHHYIRRSDANKLLVKRVKVIRPDAHEYGNQTVYHYSNKGWNEKTRLIPLEVIFRFGIPTGSSLVERLTPAYSRQLGFKDVPKEGSKFGGPILEFFSKLESTDRFLTPEQALNYSGLSFPQFQRLASQTLQLAEWLSKVFESKGLELWDGKFEWALIDGEVCLVDSIGPDELRILDPKSKTQISKEFLRTFYRNTPWFNAVKEAKGLESSDWKTVVRQKVGEPPKLSPEFRAVADVLYPSLAHAITGENPGGRAVPISDLLERINRCLKSS